MRSAFAIILLVIVSGCSKEVRVGPQASLRPLHRGPTIYEVDYDGHKYLMTFEGNTMIHSESCPCKGKDDILK